ncbi:MAG: family N-acetyltransferase [Symbiobacteriaceae bacterium]|jgi:predicted GNAT superfamily acetyltransferase|nr:family N-acetyltransferase [Symbiobacteriaceae bacterium]
MDAQIRPAQSHEELHQCVGLQEQIWGLDPRDVVPFNQLHAAHAWGGQVLVAVAGERVVGFSYGFAGQRDGRPIICSHMLGLLPEYRGQDLGARLKLAQGRWALAHGYSLITWTFDPLEAVNARLNIARLGGIAREYLVDYYGTMSDGINQGLPSDRLLVEWHVGAASTARADPASAEVLRCPVPVGVQQLKKTDPAAALRWRLDVRERLQTAFAAGYVITGFDIADDELGHYLLTKEEAPCA